VDRAREATTLMGATTPLRMGESTLVVRTDFSDDAAWAAVCGEMSKPRKFGFRANLDFLSDRQYEGMTADALVALAPESHTFFFVVDGRALTDPEQPVLVVSYFDSPPRTLRVIPSEMWSVENNLSIGNMDFEEFESSAGSEGVFRGF